MMEYIASISYGKDSLAMLEVIKLNGSHYNGGHYGNRNDTRRLTADGGI